MSDYKVIYLCDHCNKSDLHCKTLDCGRHLCSECIEEVECPCDRCKTALPAFIPINPLCSYCRSVLTEQELKSENSVCQACQNRFADDSSISSLLYQLFSKIFFCGRGCLDEIPGSQESEIPPHILRDFKSHNFRRLQAKMRSEQSEICGMMPGSRLQEIR